MKELYSELQGRMGQGLELGEQGRRVQSIGREAQALFQETMGIMLRMEGKALTMSSCPGEELGLLWCEGKGLMRETTMHFGQGEGGVWAVAGGAVPGN